MMNSDFDGRHERMEILIDITGEYEFITNALSAAPFCYVSIMDGLPTTLKL
jgi:hypothetical protein